MKSPIDNFCIKDYPNGNITQWFAENPGLYSKYVCVGDKCLQGHNGIDIVAPWGTPIYATSSGKVVEVKDTPTGYGKHVRILDHAYEYTYGHLACIFVQVGDQVSEGQKIANMGNTGFVVSGPTPYWEYNPYAGTHLHYGVRRTSLEPEMGSAKREYASGDARYILNYENGFFGAIDPKPFLVGTPDLEEQKIKALQYTIIALCNQVISLYKQLLGRNKKIL